MTTRTAWRAMIARCTNPKHEAFGNYGARGITVCERWRNYEAFAFDMGPRPEGGTVERQDNSKGYSPENCCWATRTEQGRNKRNNVMVEMDGERLALSEWAERYSIKYQTVWRRIFVAGWDAPQAIKTPVTGGWRKGLPRGNGLRDVEPMAEGARRGVEWSDPKTKGREFAPIVEAAE